MWDRDPNKPSDAGLLLMAEKAVVSENGHGGSVHKPLNGDGRSGSAEHKVWKRWARAALVVKKGWMFATRGSVALEFHSSGRSGRMVHWSRSKSRTCAWTAERHSSSENWTKDCPDKVAADRTEEAMEDAFGLTIMINESTEAFTGRSRLVFTVFRRKGESCPQTPEARLSCMDADSGAWVQRSCLPHAEAGRLRY